MFAGKISISTKGQLISKANCQVQDSSKNQWMNSFLLSSMRRVFVRFLEESSVWQFAFEINWPLVVNIEAIHCQDSNGNDVSLTKITSQIKFSRIVHGHNIYEHTHDFNFAGLVFPLNAAKVLFTDRYNDKRYNDKTFIYEFCVLWITT